MALPIGTTGSLAPAFASARPVCLAVKPLSTLALYGRFLFALKGPYEHLRYCLGGDHPSQTAYQTLSSARLTGQS